MRRRLNVRRQEEQRFQDWKWTHIALIWEDEIAVVDLEYDG